jgi:sugar phosphate isomerase/epimerase
MTSRRTFIQGASAAALCGTGVLSAVRAYAQSLRLPLGIQLYSVRDLLPKDYDGTLKMVGGLGYREVEAAGFQNHSPEDVKKSLQAANLRCVSAHYPSDLLHQKFDEILAFHKALGTAQYIICSSPGFRTPPAKRGQVQTMDDWRWNAEEFNKFGAKVSAAGMKFGYHNHIHELEMVDGQMPYEELLKLTDPAHVTMELDCGWAVVAGANPVDVLQKHGSRISMLHVKDFVKPAAGVTGHEAYKPTELGRGFIDYKPILAAAAKTKSIKHVFVEQEAFDVPPEESLRIDAAYMQALLK